MSRYFYSKNGRSFGPHSGSEIQALALQGLICPDDMIRKEGGDFVLARKVRGLTFGDTQAAASPKPLTLGGPSPLPSSTSNPPSVPFDFTVAGSAEPGPSGAREVQPVNVPAQSGRRSSGRMILVGIAGLLFVVWEVRSLKNDLAANLSNLESSMARAYQAMAAYRSNLTYPNLAAAQEATGRLYDQAGRLEDAARQRTWLEAANPLATKRYQARQDQVKALGAQQEALMVVLENCDELARSPHAIKTNATAGDSVSSPIIDQYSRAIIRARGGNILASESLQEYSHGVSDVGRTRITSICREAELAAAQAAFIQHQRGPSRSRLGTGGHESGATGAPQPQGAPTGQRSKSILIKHLVSKIAPVLARTTLEVCEDTAQGDPDLRTLIPSLLTVQSRSAELYATELEKSLARFGSDLNGVPEEQITAALEPASKEVLQTLMHEFVGPLQAKRFSRPIR